MHLRGGTSDGTIFLNYSETGNIILANGGGNVGIGTTNPGIYKLAVEGTIGAREVKVTLNNWSDFVFENDYKLLDLKDVEEYIVKNNRLPDIPSKSEVIEEGISLGEMDAKLLQKIEELTLYTIEQEKKIEKLEKLVEQLLENE